MTSRHITEEILIRDGWVKERYGFSRGSVPALSSTARGTYQAGLLSGAHPWSGAGLEGRARKYSGRYAASRDALLARLDALPGVDATTILVKSKDDHRLRRVLLIDAHGKQTRRTA